jgi:hypothetical protein
MNFHDFQITSPESETKAPYRTKKKRQAEDDDVEDDTLEVGVHVGY